MAIDNTPERRTDRRMKGLSRRHRIYTIHTTYPKKKSPGGDLERIGILGSRMPRSRAIWLVWIKDDFAV
ncbi:hypothetical protein KQX54_019372 [Cotesia glomerata]|uniref:Uncharacterized protein n=1 Tax=Cotesia glomerata TaxID=32391 RepID=A0AAV7I2R4_COTGL|nr:hypothetical protein KQX54_019372 [Cotesia glomerata]